MRRVIMVVAATSIWLLLSSAPWAWQTNINGPGTNFDVGGAVAVDATGDVIAAGKINGGKVQDFAVFKLAGATGIERWRRILSSPADSGGSAHAVAADARGDVVAAGVVGRSAGGHNGVTHFAVIKLKGATGVEMWRRILTGRPKDSYSEANAVAVDSAGNVVAAGQTVNAGTGGDFTVVKLDGNSGVERWRRIIDCGRGAGLKDEAMAIALDAAGDVVAAGEMCGFAFALGGVGSEKPLEFTSEFTVVKLDGTSGAERWRYVIGSTDRMRIAAAVTVDAAGSVVVTGSTGSLQPRSGEAARPTPLTQRFDFIVVKLDGDSGVERWRRVVTSQFGGDGRAVVVDGAGDVVAAGLTEVAALSLDPSKSLPPRPTIVKLDGATGAELWRRFVTGNHPAKVLRFVLEGGIGGVAVDAANDVMVAGSTSNAGTGDDFTVVKLDGRTGNERWRRVISGTAKASWDTAAAVAVDAAGNVVAVGRTDNAGTSFDFTVVKLRGSDGQLYRPGKGKGSRP
jgi:hypothetical protein